MRNRFDVEFSYSEELKDETRRYKNISPEMFYRLREKFVKTYGDNLLEISVYFHDTDKRFEPFCWYPEEDEEYNNPIAFYSRYGW